MNETPSSVTNKQTQELTTESKLLPKRLKKDVAATTGSSTKPTMTEASATDEESGEEQSRTFTVHIRVYETAAAEKKCGRGTKTAMTTFTSKGPFKLDTLSSFARFKMKIASKPILSCELGALPVSKFEWRFEGQPQSAPCKKIADEAGFEALIDAIKAKHATKNVVVWLYTPEPTTDVEMVSEFGAYMQLI